MLRRAQHEGLVLSLSKDESFQMSGGMTRQLEGAAQAAPPPPEPTPARESRAVARIDCLAPAP